MKPIITAVLLILITVQSGQSQDLKFKEKRLYFHCRVYSTDGTTYKGWLGYLTDSSLLMAKKPINLQSEAYSKERMRSFDYSSLQQLKLQRKASVGRGILYGSLIGAATGFIVGLAMGDDPDRVVKEANFFSDGFSYVKVPGIKATEKGIAGAIAGGVGGVIIGGIIGAVAHKTFIIQGSKKKFIEMKETTLERIYSVKSQQ
jgi:hypothetical protein